AGENFAATHTSTAGYGWGGTSRLLPRYAAMRLLNSSPRIRASSDQRRLVCSQKFGGGWGMRFRRVTVLVGAFLMAALIAADASAAGFRLRVEDISDPSNPNGGGVVVTDGRR